MSDPTRDPETDEIALGQALLGGQIDRRGFVRQALAMGLGLSSVAMWLSGCKKDSAASSTATATGAAAAVEPELNIYIWSDYLAEDTVANFEKEFGVKAVVDTFESNEEAVAKLQSGASSYDLVCPSGYAVEVMRALDLLAPIDRTRLTNLAQLQKGFLDPPFDPGMKYTIPWMWGVTGIAYRKDKVSAPVDSWAVFHDAQYKNKMTQMDDMRDTLGGWLKYRGKSLNSVDAGELAEAKADALKAKANLQSYISAPVKSALIGGDVVVAMLWDGDTKQAMAESDQIAFVVPKEGSAIWTDSMVIPKSAPHKNAAHAFLDYILRPKVAADISKATGYGTPNEGALALLDKPTRMPEGKERAILEYARDLGKGMEAWDRVWTEIKAG